MVKLTMELRVAEEPMKISEMEEKTGLSKSQVTNALKTLQKLSLATNTMKKGLTGEYKLNQKAFKRADYYLQQYKQ